ncbi:hypothetical protein QUC31_019639 [Theobroma cacao]|uniref:NB-ARC domain-containing disease resistance-like protein n=1 Tax=Theobroma cacao TaxID=3641 RepID=A0A061GR03_THECC|nr:NB-ARC domain-containing disease resistance-like protein [Theobroma cacao]
MGGLLSTKGKNASEWKRLCNSLNAQLDSSPHLTYVKKILSLSYLDLPSYLKSCFLYLCVFPEDHSINCARLIRLWAADGFSKRKQGMTLEEVAREYLIKLNHRNLIQVAQIDSIGRVRECRVHDLMREVILSKSEELSLIQTQPGYLTATDGIGRHLSISKRANNSSMSVGNFQTHSIMFF